MADEAYEGHGRGRGGSDSANDGEGGQGVGGAEEGKLLGVAGCED